MRKEYDLKKMKLVDNPYIEKLKKVSIKFGEAQAPPNHWTKLLGDRILNLFEKKL